MPTKARRKREAERAALADPPPHVAKRRVPGMKNPFAAAAACRFWRFDPDSGELYLSDAHGTGGNLARLADADDDAETLRNKYPERWGRRGQAKWIAAREGISERTVRRYFARLKK